MHTLLAGLMAKQGPLASPGSHTLKIHVAGLTGEATSAMLADTALSPQLRVPHVVWSALLAGGILGSIRLLTGEAISAMLAASALPRTAASCRGSLCFLSLMAASVGPCMAAGARLMASRSSPTAASAPARTVANVFVCCSRMPAWQIVGGPLHPGSLCPWGHVRKGLHDSSMAQSDGLGKAMLG